MTRAEILGMLPRRPDLRAGYRAACRRAEAAGRLAGEFDERLRALEDVVLHGGSPVVYRSGDGWCEAMTAGDGGAFRFAFAARDGESYEVRAFEDGRPRPLPAARDLRAARRAVKDWAAGGTRGRPC